MSALMFADAICCDIVPICVGGELACSVNPEYPESMDDCDKGDETGKNVSAM